MVLKKEEWTQDGLTDLFISNINKDAGAEIAYNLGVSEDPAKIKRWDSTGSKLLDGICSGSTLKGRAGFPAGRFVEISGAESIGKSHIAYQVARIIQENGGYTNYDDTELASSIGNLQALGIDTSKNFIYSKPNTIEQVFESSLSFLKTADSIPKSKKKDIPLCIVWDSVGGIGSKAEELMAMDDAQRPGHNARIINLGLRKVKNAIDRNDCLFVIVNQIYDIIGAGMYDKKTQTKGGKGLKYDCSVRLELKPVCHVFPNEMSPKEGYAAKASPIGIKIRATTVKNKVASPFRSVEFEIHFGVGIKEHMSIWAWLVEAEEIQTSKGIVKIISNSAWKEIGLFDSKTGEEIFTSGKFRKKDIEQVLNGEYPSVVGKHEVFNDALEVLMRDKMDPKNRKANEFDATNPAMMETVSEADQKAKDAFKDLLE